jgi:hypothetical protein
MELRRSFVTEEQLAAAGYPQHTMDSYKKLLIDQPFRPTDPTCAYDLMPFKLYESNYTGKFKVQCDKCKEYYCLNKQGQIHLHSRCEQIAKAKKALKKDDTPLDYEEAPDPEIPLHFGRAVTNATDDNFVL